MGQGHQLAFTAPSSTKPMLTACKDALCVHMFHHTADYNVLLYLAAEAG